MDSMEKDEELTSDYKQTSLSLQQSNNENNNSKKSSKRITANDGGSGSNNFLASLYSRCIRYSSRRGRKQTTNNNNNNTGGSSNHYPHPQPHHHNHQSNFCLNFCGYRSSDNSHPQGVRATLHRDSTNYSYPLQNDKRQENSVNKPDSISQSENMQTSSPTSCLSSSLSKTSTSTAMIATPTPTTTTTTAGVTTSVSTTHSGQINSIIHCPLTNNCTNIDPHITTTTPVHNDKSQRVDNLHSDTVKPSASGMNDAEDKSSTGTSIRLTTTISNNTMCKSSTGGFNNNNKDQGKPLEMSNALVCDPTKLCAKCRENVCLLSGDFKQILLSTKNQTDRQVSSGVGESDSKVDNNNNKSGDTSASNKVKEIELTIEKYEQHMKYLFDHIDKTKEKCCQTVTSSNSDVSDDNNTSNQNSNINNNRLWDAFNTLTPNHEDVIRPSHNEINTFHVDDEIDYEERANEVNQVYEGGKLMIIKKDINNNNNNNNNINQHFNCHSMNRLMINHNGDDIDEEKRIITIYRKLHNLRCQIESFSYLSWLGLTSEPPTNKVLVPGSNAPAPNPQMHLIRRSDADSRRNIQEFRRLCKEPVSQEDLLELRSSTFNNWSRTDAQLMRLVREMFKELGFIDHYKLQYHRLDLWLSDIYRRYNRIPFHNYKHAFMVTQMCYVLLWGGKLTKLLDIDDQLTLIMSAICHDLDHPGFNNAYQINAGTVLAMRYNDQSPLENHHSAVAFDLLSHAEVDPFAHLPLNVRQRIRKGMIRCILATDMSRHNEILDEFNRLVVSDLQAAWEIDANSKKPAWVTNKTHKDLVMMIILKISDISNEARPLSVAGPWINRLLAEFFNQSDYEKLVGLPVAPFMDRHKVTKSASQCGFIRFVILPLFESLAKLLPEVKPIIVQPAMEQLAYYTELHANEEKKVKAENQKVNSVASQNDNDNHNSSNSNNNNNSNNNTNNQSATDKQS